MTLNHNFSFQEDKSENLEQRNKTRGQFNKGLTLPFTCITPAFLISNLKLKYWHFKGLKLMLTLPKIWKWHLKYQKLAFKMPKIWKWNLKLQKWCLGFFLMDPRFQDTGLQNGKFFPLFIGQLLDVSHFW